MDPIRRLLSYATMYVDLDMVPNFFETLVSFIRKSKLCGKNTKIYDNEIRQRSKHVSNN